MLTLFSKLQNSLSEGKRIASLEKRWINIMTMLGAYNKLKQTYSLNQTQITSYGFKSTCLIVDGLSCSKLEDIRPIIEDNLGCLINLERKGRSNIVYIDFVYNTPTHFKYEYVPNLKAHELYLGLNYSNATIVSDQVKYPHVLITGGTRSGKSKMMDCMLTNLINATTEEELELYLIQVAKSDLVLYEDCKQTRAFADSLEKTLIVLNHISDKMKERSELIRPYRKVAMADNYRDYNKLKGLHALSTVYVVFDEMSSLFELKGCKGEEKESKELIIKYIKEIAQFGSGLGVFLICSLQRPTVDNLPPFIKSQCTTIISFRQNNSKSSEVALDDPNLAMGLEQREFIVKFASKTTFGLVPLVNNKTVYQILKPHIFKNKRNLFRDLKISKKNPKPTYEKVKGKSKEEVLKENISKIPNFVPYEVKKGREKKK